MNLNELKVSRRAVLRALPAVGMCLNLRGFAAPPGSAEEKIAAIEKGIGARLGVVALDTGSGRRIGYRADERFAMCSTFKLLLAGCILSRTDKGSERLSRRIPYTKQDLLEYAPVTGTAENLRAGAMTVGNLCAAAVEVSDNTAANLLLDQVGGPAGLTAFVRSLGDRVTRLDRKEPELNTAVAGDVRDTTSPEAMAGSMEKLLVGNALNLASRKLLAVWLRQSTTGGKRLRAGVPASWQVGDKTGTGYRGAIGDAGIFWPPQRKPILIAAYVMEGDASRTQREQAIASVGRVVAEWIVAGA
jgi:beta-lactamase class A